MFRNKCDVSGCLGLTLAGRTGRRELGFGRAGSRLGRVVRNPDTAALVAVRRSSLLPLLLDVEVVAGFLGRSPAAVVDSPGPAPAIRIGLTDTAGIADYIGCRGQTL